MGFREDSIAVAIRVGQDYFTGNSCPSSADADTIVESLGCEGNDMFEYRVNCPERGWQEYLRARRKTLPVPPGRSPLTVVKGQ
ncbi:hypothetical protein ACT89R_31175 (plasmid) [Rhodococcus qingshengii]